MLLGLSKLTSKTSGCEPGGSGTSLSRRFSKTIVRGSETHTTSANDNNCYVVAHQLPVVVTAGVDKIEPAHYLTVDADAINSAHSSLLSEAAFPVSKTTMWAGAAASTTGGTAETSTATASDESASASSANPGSNAGGTGGPTARVLLGRRAIAIVGMIV